MKKFLVVENVGCRSEDDMFVNTTLQVLGTVDTIDEAFDLGVQSLTKYAHEQFEYLLDDGDEGEFTEYTSSYLDCIDRVEVNFTNEDFPVMIPVPVLELDWTDEHDYYREVIQVQVIKLLED